MNKEAVLQRHPDAFSIQIRSDIWEIYDGEPVTQLIGTGETEVDAWRDATIIRRRNEN